jgi:hypothetical protein
MSAILAEGDGYAILSAGALVVDRSSPSGSKGPADMIGSIISVDAGMTKAKVMEWGKDNQLPNYREVLVADNNIVPSLMATRRNITLGRGLMAYKEEIDEKGEEKIVRVAMPAAAKAFFDANDIDDYLATQARNLMFHAAMPSEFVRDKKGDIKKMNALHCRHVRLGEQDQRGKVREMYWKGLWGKKREGSNRNTVDQPAQRLPLYLADKKQPKFGLWVVDDLLCNDEYYPIPFWWGSEEWIKLANQIPLFHLANLEHGFSMRWHIEVPKNYFLNAKAAETVTDPAEKKKFTDAATAKKREFLTKLNETLQGLSNAGKTVVTEYDVNVSVGKEYPGIKITPMTYDMKDDALIKLFDASNAANMSAQGVHPTLANIQTQGKLSSGSEIRNAFLMYLAINTPLPRRLLLKAINIVKRENGWKDDIHFGFKDMLLTNLDEDKSGVKETNEPPE